MIDYTIERIGYEIVEDLALWADSDCLIDDLENLSQTEVDEKIQQWAREAIVSYATTFSV